MAVNLFNPNFYRAVNPDLRGLNDQQAFDHLINFGLNERRLFSPIVDLNLYADSNPGLSFAGLNTPRQLFDHLSNFGVSEGRRFSFVFDPSFYRNANSDLAAAGLSNEQLFNHFQTLGLNEGRASAITFNPSFYLSVNPDLQQAGFNRQQALEHFRLIGINEGRTASPFFNVRFYLASNPDLGQAFGTNFREAFEHFILNGISEGRVAAPGGVTPPPPLPPPPQPQPDPNEPGNTPQTALNVGSLSGTRTFNDSIGNNDPNDYYRFGLSGPTNLNVVLNGLNQDADLELFLDANNNGTVDAGERVGISEQQGTLQDSITGFFTQGNYFVNVLPGIPGAQTPYNLNLIATPASGDLGGNSPSNATNLGPLVGNRTFNDFVGSADPEDYFRFILNDVRNVNLVLSGLGDDADLRLYRDLNNNGAIDNGELLVESIQSGTNADSINRTLDPGAYFVLVSRAFDGANTNYTLSLSA